MLRDARNIVSALAFVLSLAAASCVGPLWHQADRPATVSERAAYLMTVPDAALAQAMSDLGFRIAEHPPYQGDLLLTLHIDGQRAVARLTSDDFFVDQEASPLPLEVSALALKVARSQGLADFIRDSGTVEQRDESGQ